MYLESTNAIECLVKCKNMVPMVSMVSIVKMHQLFTKILYFKEIFKIKICRRVVSASCCLWVVLSAKCLYTHLFYVVSWPEPILQVWMVFYYWWYQFRKINIFERMKLLAILLIKSGSDCPSMAGVSLVLGSYSSNLYN